MVKAHTSSSNLQPAAPLAPKSHGSPGKGGAATVRKAVGEELANWLNTVDSSEMDVRKFRAVLNHKFMSLGFEDTIQPPAT